MENRWVFLVDRYEGMAAKGINLLSGAVSASLPYVLPVLYIDTVTDAEIEENNLIVAGSPKSNRILAELVNSGVLSVPDDPEGYGIYVGESIYDPEKQIIAIGGYHDRGILYGCVDFCNQYCGMIGNQRGYLHAEHFFEKAFHVKMPEWKHSAVPAIKTRALWTWGHVIYDYRRFFDNMLMLRLNEIVIWNDRAPINGREVVAYAHALGIKVIWGFSWGWDQKCARIADAFTPESAAALKAKVLKTYEEEYAKLGGDGIYFQSFTEMTAEAADGKPVAELVTELVNDIAGELLEIHPGLHIQFGLHATSVKTRLEILQRTDKRIYIVWEDCGAFPYAYDPDSIENFEETYEFTEKIVSLRGRDELFGCVLKGLLNLDWTNFEHFSKPYILGEKNEIYLHDRSVRKNKSWKVIQAAWLKNAVYAQKIIALIAEKGGVPVVEALVEDAMFEKDVFFPVAVYAELLWTPGRELGELIECVSNYPSVTFANLK